MNLDIKTTKPPQISWTAKIFRLSSFKWKHFCSSTTLDVVNDECCPIVNPANNTDPNYANLRDSVVNHGIHRHLWRSRSKPRRKNEDEDNELAVENEVQANSRNELVNDFLLNPNDKWNSKMKFISKQLVSDGLHLIEPQVSEPCITGLDNDDQEIICAVEKSSARKISLYLILMVSSFILCLLPRIYGDKIPNLFLPCPWLFYGFNFALMLAAAASVVSIDTISNIPKVTRSFWNLAVVSILAALALFLFSFGVWVMSL